MERLQDYFVKGGICMWPLLVCSIVGLAFIIERALFYHRATIDTPAFLDKMRKVIRKGKIKEAIRICESYRGPIASILKAGLLKFHRGTDEMERALEFAGGLELSRLERGLVALVTVSNIAPLFGFLGTVTGMITAFDAMAQQGLNNPTLVARGISEALITTAAGLFIAIPVLAAYNYYTSRVSKLVLEMEESAALMLEFLSESSDLDSETDEPAEQIEEAIERTPPF